MLRSHLRQRLVLINAVAVQSACGGADCGESSLRSSEASIHYIYVN